MKDFIVGLLASLLISLFGFIVYALYIFVSIGVPLLIVLWIFKKIFL